MNIPENFKTDTTATRTLGIILLITFPFIGFYMGKKYQEKISPKVIQANLRIKPTPTPTPKPTPTVTPFPGQLPNNDESTVVFEYTTYINTTHKYTLTYPKNWSIASAEADLNEDFTDANCCNAAKLRIYNKRVIWEFTVNPPKVDLPGPKECLSKDIVCDYSNQPMQIMGFPLQRTIIRLKKNNKVLEAFISTPGKGPGFGEVGVTNQYTIPTQTKYKIEYKGDAIDKFLPLLDGITESLQKTP